MDIKKLLVTMSISAVFVFSIMSFIIITQQDNSVNIPVTNNSIIGDTYSDLETSIQNTKDKAETSSNTFEDIAPTQQYGELEVTSIISPTRTAKTILYGFWNILIKLPMSILGVDESIMNLLTSILIIFVVIGIWAIWKGVVS